MLFCLLLVNLCCSFNRGFCKECVLKAPLGRYPRLVLYLFQLSANIFLDLGVEIVQKETTNAIGVLIWESALVMAMLIVQGNL